MTIGTFWESGKRILWNWKVVIGKLGIRQAWTSKRRVPRNADHMKYFCNVRKQFHCVKWDGWIVWVVSSQKILDLNMLHSDASIVRLSIYLNLSRNGSKKPVIFTAFRDLPVLITSTHFSFQQPKFFYNVSKCQEFSISMQLKRSTCVSSCCQVVKAENQAAEDWCCQHRFFCG